MTADYSPPFSISSLVLSQVADITERVGRLSARPDSQASLRLRRINRIRTIHGTLAIEGNRLTERQITAILDGKRVLAPPREVQEVRNALSAYDRFRHWTPSAEADLLEAHRILMTGLLDHPGIYRSGGGGVMAATVWGGGEDGGNGQARSHSVFSWTGVKGRGGCTGKVRVVW